MYLTLNMIPLLGTFLLWSSIGVILFVSASTATVPGSITLDPTPVSLNVIIDSSHWNDGPVARAQLNRFTAKHPQVTIQPIDIPESTSDLVTYLTSKYFTPKSDALDLFVTDVVYPGQLEPYCLDLLQYNLTDVAAQFSDGVIQNNMAKGKLVALPFYGDYGVLYYRTDLLAKYGFTSPPTTYAQLANMSSIILKGEHGSGVNPNLQGFSFQGYAYEGLTCDFMEWLASYQGGTVLDLDANGNVEVTINNENAIAGLDTWASWVGGIAPVTAVDDKEAESLALFTAGNAIFLRSWPYAFPILDAVPTLHGKYQCTYPPSHVEGQQGFSVQGGFGLSINKYSSHPEWTVELIKHMLSPDEMFIRGRDAAQIPPVKAGVIPNAGDMCNRTIPSWCDVPTPNIISRPSTLSAPHYVDLSELIYRGMNDVLVGRYNATKLVTVLECSIGSLLNINVPRCQAGAIIPYEQPDIVTQALIATSAILMGFISVVLVLSIIFREHRIMKASSPTFLYVMLFGALMGTSAVMPMVTYEPTSHTCRVQIWLAHLGFILLFGSLFLKTYRLRAILAEIQFRIVNITDMQLLMKQGLLCLAVAIYLMVWTTVDSPTPTLEVDSGTSYVVCKSSVSFWPNLILVAEGLFIGFGIYLCIAVRSLPKLFNESEFIGIAIYNVGALGSIILFITKIALTEYNKAVLFETVGILVVVTVTVSVIFVPKFFVIATVKAVPPVPEASNLATVTMSSLPNLTLDRVAPPSPGNPPPTMIPQSTKGTPSAMVRQLQAAAQQLSHDANNASLGSRAAPRSGVTVAAACPLPDTKSDDQRLNPNTSIPLLQILNSHPAVSSDSSPASQFASIKTTLTQFQAENTELRRLLLALCGGPPATASSLLSTTAIDLPTTLLNLSHLEGAFPSTADANRRSNDTGVDATRAGAVPPPPPAAIANAPSELLMVEPGPDAPLLNPNQSNSPPPGPAVSYAPSTPPVTSISTSSGSNSSLDLNPIHIHIAPDASFSPVVTNDT